MAATTTTESGMETTTDFPMYADFIAAPASSMSPEAIEHLQHNQITFEIPSAHDLKHIDALHTFNTLLQRFGNVAYDTARQQHPLPHDAVDETITTEQIAKSVVLDLADLQNDATSNAFERFFADSDMHAIINYLWIGVVTSLIILSVVFILFSCYFYRKFREWKKCNKDIRTQLQSDLYAGSSAGLGVSCDRRLLNTNGQPAGAGDAAFYQIESPPCYTIATGLPTYDEALHHQHKNQHQRQHQHQHQASHFSYGMKYIYPSIAAVHHHHHAACTAPATISNWEKQNQLKMQSKVKQQQQPQYKPSEQQKCKLSTAEAAGGAMPVDIPHSAAAPPAYVDVAADLQALLSVDVAPKREGKQCNADSVYITMPADNNTLSATTASTSKSQSQSQSQSKSFVTATNGKTAPNDCTSLASLTSASRSASASSLIVVVA